MNESKRDHENGFGVESAADQTPENGCQTNQTADSTRHDNAHEQRDGSAKSSSKTPGLESGRATSGSGKQPGNSVSFPSSPDYCQASSTAAPDEKPATPGTGSKKNETRNPATPDTRECPQMGCRQDIGGLSSVGPDSVVVDPCGHVVSDDQLQDVVGTSQQSTRLLADGGSSLRPWKDLTGFQRDLLFVVADLQESNRGAKGVDIRQQVNEDNDIVDASKATVWRNLDDLAEGGYVSKSETSGKNYRYQLTTGAVDAMASEMHQRAATLADLDEAPVTTPADGREEGGA